ncbi:MAG: glycosyltransferase family 2 protein [Paracoccaceae bacterium]
MSISPGDMPTVSVIVVSRGRAASLMRTLLGIAQLAYPSFEVIVVADPLGIEAAKNTILGPFAKLVAFEEANISAARNAGIALASGEIIAFIDDDAVPEPSWLKHLCAPFLDSNTGATGGFVRGRNGISFQWRARLVDQTGRHSAIAHEGTAPFAPKIPPGMAVRTEGTNCAFRRDLLLSMGGFDPAFHFYMDETDLNMRLAGMKQQVVLAPLAQVHHGFAASDQRYENRAPKSLFDIGASTSVFLRKHANKAAIEPSLTQLRADQRKRLIAHMVQGTCEPRDVNALMKTLEDGIEAGKSRSINPLPRISPTLMPFIPVPALFEGSKILSGRRFSRRRLRKEAAQMVASGNRVSLFEFSFTGLFHRVSFRPEGYWLQRGGIFGRADRNEPRFRITTFKQRLACEVSRIASLRQF